MFSMLIVDDEEIIREGIRNYVDWGSMGIRISDEAKDGREAWRKVRELNPDILLTDVVMPKMNGIELIKRTREAAYTMKIVMLSAFQDFHYIKSAIKYDAVDYLLKPFNQDELKLVMGKVIMQLQRDLAIEKYLPEANAAANTFKIDLVMQERKVVREVKGLIEDHYCEKLTLQDIADNVYLSVNHVAYLFKKETGNTIVDFMTKVRIKNAKRLLQDSSYKVYEVAENTGYTDPNYFAKVFKKYTGLSPNEYRSLFG